MKRGSPCQFIAIVLVFGLSIGAPAADLPGTGADTGKTVVYRDTWGVPHIYAPTVEAGMYAMGYEQAADRPEELLKNLARGIGESARFDGEDGLRSDKVAHMWDLYNACKRAADRVDPNVRKIMQSFVNGINDYYARHPESVPGWWGDRKTDEFMVMAFGRLFLQNWSFDDGFDDMKRAGIEPGTDEFKRGSNQWSVSPQRSAEKVPILYIDPHLGWLGVTRFWEFRIHAGDLKGSGFSLPGQPFIGLGHNDKVAWAMTTGGPDTADVYELTLQPNDRTKYLYDGEWRSLTSRKVTLTVKDSDPATLTVWESHHGPIAAFANGKAYAVKSSYADAVEGNEAWYEFNFAEDYKGIMAGLATLQVFPQNVMCADTSGNIYYQRTGRVPKRPEGYDWSRPVDGSTSETEWLGLHSADDHLQVLNPPQGYMQNCNIPPDSMILNSPFRLEKTLPYLFADLSHGGQRDGWNNTRGARALELLSADDSVTVEEALAYAVDAKLYGADRWIAALKMADAKFGQSARADAAIAAALAELLQWDSQLLPESKGALKYYYWRKQLLADHGAEKVGPVERRINNFRAPLGVPNPPLEFSDEELQGMMSSFVNAMAKMRADWGALDKSYGDMFRVGRDGRSWPCGGGGDGDVQMTTLRNVGYGRERDDRTRWGRSGQTSTQIVVLSMPIRSWTYVPLGQSDDSASPHFADQAEKLFSRGILKETWWLPEQLADHIESRTVIESAK